MCYLAAVPYIMMAVSAAVTVAGGVQQANAQRSEAAAQAAVDQNNAAIARTQAQDAANVGAQDQEQSAWRTRAILGQQKAAAAANNLDMDIGTPSDLMANTALLGSIDRQRIALNASQKAWGFQAEATSYMNQGAQARFAGDAAARATILTTIGKTLQTGASAYMGGAFSGIGAGAANMGSGMDGFSAGAGGGTGGGP